MQSQALFWCLCINAASLWTQISFSAGFFRRQAVLPAAQMPVNLLSPFCPISFSPGLGGFSRDKDEAFPAIRAIYSEPHVEHAWNILPSNVARCLWSVFLYFIVRAQGFYWLLKQIFDSPPVRRISWCHASLLIGGQFHKGKCKTSLLWSQLKWNITLFILTWRVQVWLTDFLWNSSLRHASEVQLLGTY